MRGKKRKVISLQNALIYDSITAASAAVPAARPECIVRCCARERSSAGGLTWRYLDELLDKYIGGLIDSEKAPLREICDRELAAMAIDIIYNQRRA